MSAREVRPVPPERLEQALALVWAVFLEFEAPDYSAEGVAEFRAYLDPATVRQRIQAGGMRLWCCLEEERIIGVIATRPRDHISLLFVQGAHHRQGVARALLEAVRADWTAAGITRATVHASPYGLEAYRRLGFVATGEEQVVNGLRFTPMELK